MKFTPMAIWGRELRHYRQGAGLTQQELADEITYSKSLISQIETGQTPATEEFAEACDERLQTGGALVRLLDYRRGNGFPVYFRDWVPLEASASILRAFEPNVIYGLLQTPEYATAMLYGNEAAAAVRIERQSILSGDSPPALHVVLDESVLYREIGSPCVMRDQLRYLINVISPTVTVQIVPQENHAGVQGAWVLATMSDGAAVAYVETAARGFVTDSREDLARLTAAWESLRSQALSVKASIELIEKAAERWTT
ncbi:helix-turn-helix transcriptional regulator [Actinoallomurus vinaceus]|uniref:Helix-turn-helix transcriptional regulator n=1 Tax=Actinoallomurus vinaceus TaxID=1080074 RepID=A0ABP8U4U1_9ACTN